MSPLTVDGRRYVIAGLPHGDWARNVRARVMRAFPREAPHGVPMFVKLGLVAKADPDEFAAAADRVAVFRVTAS
ncbi:hypothetical protein [Amycolatopsis kentuckyensis]|uniref:hypothetical protein n=1 Tax=Amycolatopsis kentuckyensis TaxID=218823 RepID=UPI00356ABA62